MNKIGNTIKNVRSSISLLVLKELTNRTILDSLHVESTIIQKWVANYKADEYDFNALRELAKSTSPCNIQPVKSCRTCINSGTLML